MNETVRMLKGVSCILSMMSFNENSNFEYEAEAFEVLNNTLTKCIDELEKMADLED